MKHEEHKILVSDILTCLKNEEHKISDILTCLKHEEHKIHSSINDMNKLWYDDPMKWEC